MKATRLPRLKICCMQNVEEAWSAVEAGAAALGLVSGMPSGPGVIEDETIAEIAAAIPPPVLSVLLTSLQDAESIIAQQRRLRPRALQLVDRLVRGDHAELRAALPGIALLQVVHVVGPESVEEARAVAPHVDAILLDSGNPALAVKQLGGTGRTHDWTLSRQIREAVAVPVFLAGGLNPENAGEAVRQVGPFGLDVCSGVRRDGKLDLALLAAFVRAASHPGS
jgi:phosphoribosylanthranilate isomerase